ncbi:hypothetical protein [Streptomyces mirabilis]|uniref:hypothetical protein n=1 Tax=Streptomyces mirabilis TaxID=68239 RepID=UPI0036C0A190
MAPAPERTTECQCWNAAAGDNGGFVQEATGWKPSALHPTMNVVQVARTAGL